ncbi:MAG: riboflavin synthase [Verrucomicrobia bacterium]|nr:MAG: riboflavin synthase [Verrucomicrobiota bacterium]
MFTGIIQKIGGIVALQRSSGAGRLALKAGAWTPPVALGESIAIEGICLTVAEISSAILWFDVLEETFAKTTLGHKKIGAVVNVERAVRAGDFLGGHIVSGHVDGVGRIQAIGRAGADRVVEVTCGAEILQGVVPKGSIALNGISLTVVAVKPTAFTVHIIPHTWANTSLCSARVGDAVNLETDLLGKYVEHQLAAREKSKVTPEQLRAAGFMD